MPEPSTEVAVRDHTPQAYRAMVTVQEIQARADLIDACKAQAMKPNIHYGVIPGTGSKPTLLKPGAEKLDVLFQLRPEFRDVEDREPDGHMTVTTYCTLVHIPTGDALVKDASGSCSTHESKYAWRKGERECPECGQAAILKGKTEAEGWFCWRKRGGCGSKFDFLDARITSQVVGRIPNPDLPDQWNTVRKMAQKRAHIAATLAATAASDVFTQDLDDEIQIVDEVGNGAPERATARPAPKSGPKPATVVSKGEDFDPNPSGETKPASKDAIPGVDPSAKPLLSAANDLALRLGMTPQEVGNLATRLFKRTVASKDLPGLSEFDARALAEELEARLKAETGGEG